MRMRKLSDWLPFISKGTREKRDQEKLQANNLELLRQRQAHYRTVTQSDSSGNDTRGEH